MQTRELRRLPSAIGKFSGATLAAHEFYHVTLASTPAPGYDHPRSPDASGAGLITPGKHMRERRKFHAPFFLRSTHHIMAGLRGARIRAYVSMRGLWAGIVCPVVITPRSPVANSIITRTAAVASCIAHEARHG